MNIRGWEFEFELDLGEEEETIASTIRDVYASSEMDVNAGGSEVLLLTLFSDGGGCEFELEYGLGISANGESLPSNSLPSLGPPYALKSE